MKTFLAPFVRAPRPQQLNILMVDDNPADQRLVEEALKTVAECAFVPLRSADDAFNHLDEGRTADLILLTLDSELKGLDFVSRLKSQDERKHIPIAIFASGAGPDEADVVQCSGAQCYLEKPLDFDGHVRLASKLVALYGSEQ